MDNNSIDDRHIRVFISSTFQDMEKEREQLIKKVFPLLRGIAGARGVVVTELDLRWGITQEESENGKVLEICLNEIDNSRPFFIGLLGDRYGWCPTEEELEKNHNIEELHPWVRQAIAEGKSVTEMEFLYGALSPKLFPNKQIDAFFWIKRGESSSDERLERLKQTVRDNIAYPCNEYVSPEDLGKQVIEAFQKILDERYPPQQLSEIDSFRLDQETYRRVLNRLYIPIEENIKQLNDFLQNDDQKVLTLVGEAGSGKSATISNWLNTQAESTRFQFISCILQASNKGADINSVLDYLNTELLQLLGREPEDSLLGNDENAEERFKQLLSEVAINNKVCIVIDGINILDEQEAKLLNWLPDIPDNCRVVLTTIEQDITYQSATRKGYFIVPITLLNDNQKKSQYIDLFLERYGKSLSIEQKSRLLNSPIIENPKTLHSILVELKNNGNYDELDKTVEQYSKVDSKENIYRLILDNAEESFGKDFVIKALLSIAVSRNGLDETTLMKITGATPLRWSQFICACSEYLFSHQGLISFSDSIMKDVMIDRYHDNIETIRRQIIQSLNLDSDNIYFALETTYQWYKLKDYKQLNYILSSIEYSLGILYQNDTGNLYKYWKEIRAANLPKWRYYTNFTKTVIGDNMNKSIFMHKVGEFRLSSYYCIRELIKDNFYLIWTRNPENRNQILTCKRLSLYYLSESLPRLHHYRLSKLLSKSLITNTKKYPELYLSAYFRQMAEINIANCNLFMGNKQQAERVFDEMLFDNCTREDIYALESRGIALLNAVCTYYLTDREKALNCFLEADKIYQSLIKNYPQCAEGYISLLLKAEMVFQGEPKALLKYEEQALSVANNALSSGILIPDSSMAQIYTTLANSIIMCGEKPSMAVQYCDVVIDTYANNIEEKCLLSSTLVSCAYIYTVSGEEVKARSVIDRLLQLPPDFSLFEFSKGDSQCWALLYYCQGVLDFSVNPEQSEQYFKKSISAYNDLGNDAFTNSYYGFANDNLGRLLYKKGNYKSAVDNFKCAIRVYKRVLALNDNIDTLCSLIDVSNNLVYSHLGLNNVITASEKIKENCNRLFRVPKTYPCYYQLVTKTYSTMADVLLRQGDKPSARKYLQEALDSAKEGGLDKDSIDYLNNALNSL
ncbi:MAG: DUF4062 domain-containing protein [Bacteroidales bacterium]|nr:DUF4062 domain-containing protein [Bacteroidales bacterium]